MTWRYERRLRRVGALTIESEKRDPIPVGYYWYDSIDPNWYDDAAVVDSLRTLWKNMVNTVFPGSYQVIRTTHHDARTGILGSEPVIGKPDRPAHDWTLIYISSPIPRWPPGTQWGLPNIAPKGAATTQDDVFPEPEYNVFPDAPDVNVNVPFWAWALGLTVVGAIVYEVAK